MAQETKVVKGGFRATLALIISIIALILSFFAYSSTGKQEDLRDRIKELQATIEVMKQETAKKMDTLRGETADTLEKLSKSLKKEEGQE
jgi:translation initiation factor IF-2